MYGSILSPSCPCLSGLIFVDGVDATGRPVIILNTATALPADRALDDVLEEAMKLLEPFLSQVIITFTDDSLRALKMLMTHELS